MKANEDKCHVLLSTSKKVFLNLSKAQIQSSSCENLLIKIDFKLNFKDHIGNTCQKASDGSLPTEPTLKL